MIFRGWTASTTPTWSTFSALRNSCVDMDLAIKHKEIASRDVRSFLYFLYFFPYTRPPVPWPSFRFYCCCKTKQVCWGRWRLFCQLHWEVWSEGVDDTVETWSHGAMESWSHGVMESWNHGVMESWSHGAMESWSHGEVKQVAVKLHSCQQPLGSTVLLSLFWWNSDKSLMPWTLCRRHPLSI